MTGIFPFAISDAISFFHFALSPKPPANRVILAPASIQNWFGISSGEFKRHVATLVDDALLFYVNEADADRLGLAAVEAIYTAARSINYPLRQPKDHLPNPSSVARAITNLKAYLAFKSLPIGWKLAISTEVPFVNHFEEENPTRKDFQTAIRVSKRQGSQETRGQSHVLIKVDSFTASRPILFPYVEHHFFRGAIPKEHRDALRVSFDDALSPEMLHWMGRLATAQANYSST